jgi:chorismate--pyruvate lyase
VTTLFANNEPDGFSWHGVTGHLAIPIYVANQFKNDETLKLSGRFSFQIPPEPRWLPQARRWQVELPAELTNWLFNTGSLTRRLRQICSGQLRVKVLSQHWARPLPSELRLLRLDHRGYAWIREVQLVCDDQPWVFARTVIPPATLHGRCRRLMRLGSRPLGEVLFTDPSIQRAEVQIACIAAPQRLHRLAFGTLSASPESIWGRRSLFHIDRQRLLVCEIFLPNLPFYSSTNNN